MSKITNTARDEVNHSWTMGGSPGAIEAQEAEGQRQLVAGSQLPADIDPDFRLELMYRGVQFHGLTDGDPMFYDVTLPDGWKFKKTDHDMWSKLIDTNGDEVAMVFYKAAFYDRSSHVRKSYAG